MIKSTDAITASPWKSHTIELDGLSDSFSSLKKIKIDSTYDAAKRIFVPEYTHVVAIAASSALSLLTDWVWKPVAGTIMTLPAEKTPQEKCLEKLGVLKTFFKQFDACTDKLTADLQSEIKATPEELDLIISSVVKLRFEVGVVDHRTRGLQEEYKEKCEKLDGMSGVSEFGNFLKQLNRLSGDRVERLQELYMKAIAKQASM